MVNLIDSGNQGRASPVIQNDIAVLLNLLNYVSRGKRGHTFANAVWSEKLA